MNRIDRRHVGDIVALLWIMGSSAAFLWCFSRAFYHAYADQIRALFSRLF